MSFKYWPEKSDRRTLMFVTDDNIGYRMEMACAVRHPQILPPARISLNGRACLSYKCDMMRTMSSAVGEGMIDAAAVRRFFMTWSVLCSLLSDYLMDAGDLCLSPEYIFFDVGGGWCFICLPGSTPDVRTGLQACIDLLADGLADHDTETAGQLFRARRLAAGSPEAVDWAAVFRTGKTLPPVQMEAVTTFSTDKIPASDCGTVVSKWRPPWRKKDGSQGTIDADRTDKMYRGIIGVMVAAVMAGLIFHLPAKGIGIILAVGGAGLVVLKKKTLLKRFQERAPVTDIPLVTDTSVHYKENAVHDATRLLCLPNVPLLAGPMGDVPVAKTPFHIGSDTTNDLVLPQSHISRRHALITEGDGIYYLEDLDSTNGTSVNDVILTSGVRHPLSDGDVLRFAGEAYRLMLTMGDGAVDFTNHS
ncbi:MAG: DUF6382 domain-containing protein [Eubacteriales bacterium]|nr:DUF6382 domain-containing protein [Eubacteriales bacterium]